MQSARCNETGHVQIGGMSMPEPGDGELVVRVRACGICGTDVLKVYNPAVPKPVQIGHEVVGAVAALGAGVDGWIVGQRLALAHHVPGYVCHYCRHGNVSMCATFKRSNILPGGFSTYVLASAIHVAQTALPLPPDLPDERAVFVEPLACCVRALKRVTLLPDDTALVVGAGAIGLMFTALLHMQRVHTAVLDPKPERIALAQRWGAALALDPTDPTAPLHIRQLSGGRGVDVVVLTVANAATFTHALALVRDGGTLLLFGAKPGDVAASVDLWELYRREITVLSSYSPAPVDLHEALALLRTNTVPLEELVTHQLPLEQIETGMHLSRTQQALKVVIRPA